MTREDVYKLIDVERDYQDKKWNESTTSTKGLHTPDEWVLYMQDYLAEAQHILARKPYPEACEDTMEIIRKVTAMGVHAMEQHLTKSRAI